MAYRHGNHSQMKLLPQSIEEYKPHDDPVRAYDAFVEALDFNELGIEINPTKVGIAEYDPKAMLKLIVYGYSYVKAVIVTSIHNLQVYLDSELVDTFDYHLTA